MRDFHWVQTAAGAIVYVKWGTTLGKVRIRQGWILALCVAAGLTTACSHDEKVVASSWDPKAAATYLDAREVWWTQWQGAARDHDTFCVSCHTAMPYALSRSALRKPLAEAAPSANEGVLLANVTKRVRLWKEVGPYYADSGYGSNKAAESRGTEAVLNALILASHDSPDGHLSDDTRAAFTYMWELQLTAGAKKGSWPWLQFKMEPWEANDSQYYGAAMAAIAVGMAPENYRSTPAIQDRLAMLRDYLRRESGTQSTLNRVVALWASTKLPGLLEPEQRQSILDEVSGKQQSDGGWSLTSLVWPQDWSLHSMVRRWMRSDGTSQGGSSDGYATGFITFALEEQGLSSQDPRIKRGLSWLVRNQNRTEGFWASNSVNVRRNPTSEVGRFMSDAATAYAVLALAKDNAR